MDSESDDDFYTSRKKIKTLRDKCPYIDTINRFCLDFDFEKICSITLSNTNVYACLICGKYFQGRGKETPAYAHSMEEGHHLFISLNNGSTFCLPDNYEVRDESLADIRFNLNPTFSKADLEKLPVSALSLTGSEYHPGLIGLNQIKDASYLNSIVHAICAVEPVRDYFVLKMIQETTPRLTAAFSELLKKINNWQSFKGLTSPHELLQQVSVISKGEFFASHADPFQFLEWLLPSLQAEITEPVILRTFRGERADGERFMSISFDLPMMPVFKGEKEFIPTVPIMDLFTKRFSTTKIKRFPNYLILHYKRFVKNNFFLERNSTLVRFPMTGLRLDDFGEIEPVGSQGFKYSLVACICHEGKPEEGIFKSYVLHPVSDHWFECEGLRVKKTLPQSVALVESYIQIWKRDN